ncbi:hypothetical protein [Qipengyuania sp. NPDC077563]|uniref:hypothetical protein n=1 Tax=Qipengyuania sp. NPDC077563 TaxID=3364497 RepID=UPI00384D1193
MQHIPISKLRDGFAASTTPSQHHCAITNVFFCKRVVDPRPIPVAACNNPVFEDWKNDPSIEPFEQDAIFYDYNATVERCEKIDAVFVFGQLLLDGNIWRPTSWLAGGDDLPG